MRAPLFTLLLCLFTPLAVWANPPIMLDEDTIDVTTNFRGTHVELTAFVEAEELDVQMMIVGPPATLTFRQKSRVAGLWINAEKQIVENAASYIALVGFDEAELVTACASNSLAALAHDGAANLAWACDERQRNLMANKGLFVLLDAGQGIRDLGQGFIRASAFLPPMAKPGAYGLRFWDGDGSAQTELNVRRVGLERWVLQIAENHRLLYGLLCLFLAALAGYLTNLIFSRRT